MKTTVIPSLWLDVIFRPIECEELRCSFGHLKYRTIELYLDGELYDSKRILMCNSGVELDILKAFGLDGSCYLYVNGWHCSLDLLADLWKYGNETLEGRLCIPGVATSK